MGFAQVASRAINKTPTKSGSKLTQIEELNEAGLSRAEVLRRLNDLAETTDNEVVELQVLKTAAQMHGMLIPEEAARSTPIIQLNIVGDNARINAMLCPEIEVKVENISN